MQNITAIALNAMQYDTLRLERIAVNLANVQTTGFQREILALGPMGSIGPIGSVGRPQAARPESSDLMSRMAEASPANSAVMVLRDTRPGTLRSTGQMLDLALQSRGYFELATPEGPAYTRRGEFRLDTLGRLVTAQGWPVMGRGGEIHLGLDGGAVQVDGDGQISADGQRVGQLKLVDVDDGSQLTHLGDGCFTATGPVHVLKDTSQAVRQGFLENANVGQGQEMVDLMRTMRHFESMSRVLQSQDEALGNAIRRLGEL